MVTANTPSLNAAKRSTLCPAMRLYDMPISGQYIRAARVLRVQNVLMKFKQSRVVAVAGDRDNILVRRAFHRPEPLRLIGRFINRASHIIGDRPVFVAMDHQHRHMHPADLTACLEAAGEKAANPGNEPAGLGRKRK